MNKETLGRSTKEKGKDLQRLLKQRRYTAVLWCNQADASANGEAEAKLGDGGGARMQRRRKEEEEVKETKGEKRMALGPIYKVKR